MEIGQALTLLPLCASLSLPLYASFSHPSLVERALKQRCSEGFE